MPYPHHEKPPETRSPGISTIDEIIERKIKPLLDSAMHHYLGVTVEEIRADITDRLRIAPYFEFSTNTDKPFKKAKELFRKEFVTRLLRRHFGNVSIAAKIAGLDRRSMHRIISRHRIDVHRFREEMTKRSYLKEMAITSLIEHTVNAYKPVLKKERVEHFYENLPDLSRNIVELLPERTMTLEETEQVWEKRYLRHHLDLNSWNISQTARKIGLRYETLHRKIKELNLKQAV